MTMKIAEVPAGLEDILDELKKEHLQEIEAVRQETKEKGEDFAKCCGLLGGIVGAIAGAALYANFDEGPTDLLYGGLSFLLGGAGGLVTGFSVGSLLRPAYEAFVNMGKESKLIAEYEQRKKDLILNAQIDHARDALMQYRAEMDPNERN